MASAWNANSATSAGLTDASGPKTRIMMAVFSDFAAGNLAIGECVDVTGWLGGYNFQWAWASGHAAGLSLARPAQ